MTEYFKNVTDAYMELEKEMEKENPDKLILEKLLVKLEQCTSRMLYRVATKVIE